MAGSNASEFNEDRLASIVRIVYTALQGDSTVTAERSSIQTSVENELRFQTPRGPVTRGSSLHAAPSSSRSSSTDRVRYNPRTNYGYTGKGKGKSGKAKEPVQLPRKELILLPSPGYNRELKIRPRRVSATADLVEEALGEVAVAAAGKLGLSSRARRRAVVKPFYLFTYFYRS